MTSDYFDPPVIGHMNFIHYWRIQPSLMSSPFPLHNFAVISKMVLFPKRRSVLSTYARFYYITNWRYLVFTLVTIHLLLCIDIIILTLLSRRCSNTYILERFYLPSLDQDALPPRRSTPRIIFVHFSRAFFQPFFLIFQ